MISRLRGLVLEKNPPSVVLDIQGVGYEVQVSMQTFYSLPATGEEIQLYTHLVVREDAHLLFGFGSREERETFQALIKVSGIGAKSALGILSALTSDELASAVANEDIKRLMAAPGIGKKTAERMVLELRGKLVGTYQHDELFTPAAVNNQNQDIINTLLALGYSDKEARTACKNLPEGTDISEGVRLALKNML